MKLAGPIRAAAESIEAGKRLIRANGDNGMSLSERLIVQLHRLNLRTPLYARKLRGTHPLQLVEVPKDPFAGVPERAAALAEGRFDFGGESCEIETVDFADLPGSAAFRDHVQSFAWLRDLAVAEPATLRASIAEFAMRKWLAAHGGEEITDAGWRPDLWGRRILHWTAHAPLILASSDAAYRSAVLGVLARGARHLDRCADRGGHGLPRIAAWAGVIAAGLLIPGGEARLARGEAGMARAIDQSLHSDGGIATRSGVDQLELVELLTALLRVYEARRQPAPEAIEDALRRAVPALLGVTLGDGALSSWQGGGPIPAERVTAAVEASGVRTRPLRQARDWGYQRLVAGQAVLVIDAAPPPAGRLAAGGCASTLAFEMSDGGQRLIVNCGGARGIAGLPPTLVEALRATAAHSTLTLADSNSTAIHADGTLGRGVIEVELDRVEQEHGSHLEASHDGYVRRFGFVHRRSFKLSGDGRELEGEDVLFPDARSARRAKPAEFALRFHLGPEVTVAGESGQDALLRLAGGADWQFSCRGATLSIEESLSVGLDGGCHGTRQLVVTGQAPIGGASVTWSLKRAG